MEIAAKTRITQAWELKSFRRSLFNLTPNRAFYKDLWANRVLFWAVVLGMASVPLCIYVPGLSDHVFYQKAISWEWGVVVGMTLVFVGSMELWKLIVARRRDVRKGSDAGEAAKV